MLKFMHIICISLYLITANIVYSADCPSYQNYENLNSVAFNPVIDIRPNVKSPKSLLKEASLWHNCVNCESALNNQINMELRASYLYQIMSQHFNRDDVALKGFHRFFEQASVEERDHANMLMSYLLKRGGNLEFRDIQKPESAKNFETPLTALQTAFELETQVYASLRKLHDVAAISEDNHLMDFLESNFYNEQIESLHEISASMTRLKRMGCGLGETLFDDQLFDSLSKKKDI